jgi:hypothetical protein
LVAEVSRGAGKVTGQPFDRDGDLTSPFDGKAGHVQLELSVGQDPVERVGVPPLIPPD